MTSASSVSTKQRESMTVAYVSRKGSYAQMGEAMSALFGGLAQRGLIAAGPPAGTYYNAPGQVPESELTWEAWVPVAGNPPEAAAEGAGVGVKRLGAAEVAATAHQGSYDGVGTTYGMLMQWITESGYQVVGPSEEVYLSDPSSTPPEQLVTEIRLPVGKT